jgi:hypothetical protein
VLFPVVYCEAAGSICANDETSPSLASHPKEEGKGNGAENDQRQSERDADLEPLKK